MILEWYVGFHHGRFRNHKGQIYPFGWLGHVEIWGYTEDDTWLFYDPQVSGTKVIVIHRHDDVIDQLEARYSLCDLILRLPNDGAKPPFNLWLPMTCASVIAHMTGVGAFTPWGLQKRLLAKGAEVIHENPERRSRRQGRAPQGTPDFRA